MIIMRTISTGFSIYLSNKIGSEGMGLYQLISSIYMFAVTVSISGMGLCMTRLVAEENAKGSTLGVKLIFKKGLVVSLLLGIFAGGLLFFFSEPIGNGLLKDGRTILSLKLLSVSLPFLSVGAVIRGYFLGLQDALKSISGDVVEQLAGILFTVMLLSVFTPKGIEPACLCLVIGSDISEVVSTLYSYILYKKTRVEIKGEAPKKIANRIFSIAFPVAVSAYFRSVLTTLENILMPIGLKKFGLSPKDALSEYGMIKGMVMPLLFFPSAVLSAFSSMLVPEVSGAYATKNQNRIDYIIRKCFKWTMIFAFFVTAVFFAFHKEIGLALYKDARVSRIIFIFAPLVPLLYLDQIVDSILKGLNQQLASMKYNSADSAIRVFLIFFLVPLIGIKGYIVMFYFGTIFNAGLSVGRLITVGRVRFKPLEWVVIPLSLSLFSAFLSRYFFGGRLFASILFSLFCYIVLLFSTREIRKSDVLYIAGIFWRK